MIFSSNDNSIIEQSINKEFLKESINNVSYHPLSLREFIGQEKVKTILIHYLIGIKNRNTKFPHTLIMGESGYGKTTLAHIISLALNKPFMEIISSSIRNIDDLIPKINKYEGGVVFIDEIHSLSVELAEQLYSMMEYFKYNGVAINHFTLIGATTEPGILIEKMPPFYNRFSLKLELDKYNLNDLIIIAKQYKNKKFSSDKISEKTYELLVKNCRGVPRKLLDMINSYIYFGNNNVEFLNSFDIIKDSYTKKDLKVLTYLINNEKGVGLQGLSSYLGTSVKNYLYEIEPWLLQNGLVVRTAKGRKITNLGMNCKIELEQILIKRGN